MTRATAYQILTKYLTNPQLIKHSLATEATMRSLAPRFAGDVEDWGITGLLHDADYEKAKGHPEKHGLLLFKLEPNSIPTNVQHAIEAHNFAFTNIKPTSSLDWALYCSDELTALIMTITLSTKSQQLAGLTPDDIIQKIRQKNFEKNANKESVYLCESKLNIPAPEFIAMALKAMQAIHEVLGL
jgi:predicted hydrolase (HD superfamily)